MKITQLIGSNNKALNIEENGINTLQSYDTKICFVKDGELFKHSEYEAYLKNNKHSNTTNRHVKLFCALHNVKSIKF